MSQRILYFDCFSGIAGDMTLGALIDLGLDAGQLKEALDTLPLPAWTLEVDEKVRMGIRGVDVHVRVGGVVEGPATDDPHHHGHDHGHGFHYADIVRAIEGGRLPAPVVDRARAAFDVIAEAEARVHGMPVEKVHFHEVGAVDSVVDIVGVAWGIWKLGVEVVGSAPPPLGRGFVRTAHGRMPLPAPATLEILRGLPVTPCPVEKELVTPTGAAFVKAWAGHVGPFPEMVVEQVGFGAGDLELEDRPNLLRLVLGRSEAAAPRCAVVECNLDDMNPEVAGYLLERLLDAGALDAWFVPVHMKKNRPALIVGALVEQPLRGAIEEILLSESTAIGLRHYPVSRTRLERSIIHVSTPFGEVPVKVARRGGKVLNAAPEFDDCAAVARREGVPLKTVYQHAVAAFVDRVRLAEPDS